MTEPTMFEELVPMRDGVRLATHVVVPDGGGPHPALVYRTPYGRAACWTAYQPMKMARRGWVVVVQDVRGRFDSEGTFRAFVQEGEDGADAVEWVSAQPWCTGDVVMTGASYMGFAQWLAAAQHPTGLRGIAPMIAGADYHDGWGSEGGVARRAQIDMWSLTIASTDRRLPPERRERAQRLRARPERLWSPPTKPSQVEGLVPEQEAWMHAPPSLDVHTITWRSRPPEIPAMQVTGWFDAFVDSAIAGYEAMRATGSGPAREAQRLVIGPWGGNGAMPRHTGDVDYGPAADGIRRDIPGEMDAWLKAAAAGAAPPGGATVFVLGTRRWVELAEWPPPSATHRLHPARGPAGGGRRGELRGARPPDGPVGGFTIDRSDPVPTLGGRAPGPLPWLPGQVSQAPLDERADILSFTSARLDAPLAVAGLVRVHLRVACTMPSAVVTAKLIDIAPDGQSLNVLDSAVRSEFEPGEPRRVTVVLGHIAIVFKAGHQIRLDVSWSNYPRLVLTDPGGRTTRGGDGYVLHGGGRHPSVLELPVVDPSVLA